MSVCSWECWLLLWNMKMSTGSDIWESLFSEWIILKWDYHQGADAKTFSQSERAPASAPVFACVCILWPHSHQRWTKWGPWVLSEMHNAKEVLHIVRVKAAVRFLKSFPCCGRCSWRFSWPNKKVRRISRREWLKSLKEWLWWLWESGSCLYYLLFFLNFTTCCLSKVQPFHLHAIPQRYSSGSKMAF